MIAGCKRWTLAFLGYVVSGLWRVLRMTWRVYEEPAGIVARRRLLGASSPGTVYVHWHSRMLLSGATQAWRGVHVLVSRFGKGEFIARAIERLGFCPIRGSTGGGGGRALRQVIRILEAGSDVAITPDGPNGPRFRVQPGCVIAAMKARAPIVPVAFECRRAWRLSTWDRVVLPWPFARVAVCSGDPIHVPADLDRAGIALSCARVEAALNDVTRRAAATIGVPVESAKIDPRGSSHHASR